jgi:hypothetical protein
MRSRSIVLGLVAATAATAALAAGPSPFIGEWHWNRATSQTPAGEPQPQQVVIDITRADAAQVLWRLTIVDENGQSHVQSFTGSGDGKPVAVEGRSDGSTGAFTVTASTLDSVYTYPDGASDRSSCSVSADRRTMTCRGTENDGQGHSATYVDVYQRQ